MTREAVINRFRKRLLRALPQRLNTDFSKPLDDFANCYHLDIENDDRDTPQLDQHVLAWKYDELLDEATVANPSRHHGKRNDDDESSVLVGEHHFPLPPYDEVMLSSGTDEIRLLQLLPGHYDDPIICNLFQIDSVHVYEFEALSYAWGSVEDQKLIYVNDWEVLVRNNLETALRSVRDESKPRILWIDALSIDQSSVLEKTNQVAKMGDIYEAAKRVLIFLGPENAASNSVFDFLAEGYSQFPDFVHSERDGELFGLRAAAYTIEHHQSLLKDFVEVLFRPWFSRIWVRQEYIRASEAPILYCGRRHVDFPGSAFNLLCEAVFRLPRLLKQPMSDVIPTHAYHEVFARAVSVFHTMKAANQYPQTLDRWLNNEGINGCQATDPRDLIFSICALFDSIAGSVLSADYSQSVEEVFMKASAWVLMMEQSPNLLVKYPPLEDRGLPSWVLDFANVRPASRHDEFVATFDTDLFSENEHKNDLVEQDIDLKIMNGDTHVDNQEEPDQSDGSGLTHGKELPFELNGDGTTCELGKDGEKIIQVNRGRTLSPEDIAKAEASTVPPYDDEGISASQYDADIDGHRSEIKLANLSHPNVIDTTPESKDVEMKDANQGSGNEPTERTRGDLENEQVPLKLYCTLHHRILAITGVQFDKIEEVFEISSSNRLDAIRQLWHLEKKFQYTPAVSRTNGHAKASSSSYQQAYIFQWAVKIPINGMISTLIPRSEYYIDFLRHGLEDSASELSEESLSELLGALVFDHEKFEAEFRVRINMKTGGGDSGPRTDSMFANAPINIFASMALEPPRYSDLTAKLVTNDEEQNHNLLSYLHELSTHILPSYLAKPEPPRSQGMSLLSYSSGASSATLNADTESMVESPMKTLRTDSGDIQSWENEREDIFSQLFQSCCFFQTKHGNPGLGAFGLKGLKAGDVVTILEGVPMPMALRKEDGDCWKIVGPVVVRGIMNGEVKSLIRDGAIEKETFKIR